MTTRICECGCGTEFTPRKSTGRFASTTCRVRWNRAKNHLAEDGHLAADARVVAIAAVRSAKAAAGRASSVVDAIRAELGDSVNSSLGQQALVLAERIDNRIDTSGSAVASLSKQLVILTAAALGGATPNAEEDPVAQVQAQVLAIRQAHAG